MKSSIRAPVRGHVQLDAILDLSRHAPLVRHVVLDHHPRGQTLQRHVRHRRPKDLLRRYSPRQKHPLQLLHRGPAVVVDHIEVGAMTHENLQHLDGSPENFVPELIFSHYNRGNSTGSGLQRRAVILAFAVHLQTDLDEGRDDVRIRV